MSRTQKNKVSMDANGWLLGKLPLHLSSAHVERKGRRLCKRTHTI